MHLLQVTSVPDALQRIRESFAPLAAEEISLASAGGRYTADEILAREDVPAFDRSAVDGYAVRAGETFGAQDTLPALLELTGEVRMAKAAPLIRPGECVYVPTGGMLPPEADAVVMIEQTEIIGTQVHVFRQVAPGENRIMRGEDLRQGQPVFGRGRRLRAPELGLLASLGTTHVTVYRRPVVAILSTGDEVVPVETPTLVPGQVRDANRAALIYLAEQMGAQAICGRILPDSPRVFRKEVDSLLRRADMVVLSGGSSIGDRDFTARILREFGEGDLLLEGLAIQPGKPTLLARHQNKPLLGLPGHPVSALSIFSLFGGAIVKRLSGAAEEEWRPSVHAILAKNVPSRPGRTDLIRVALEKTAQEPMAIPVFGRSGLLRTLAEADGVIYIPEESDGLSAGMRVEVFLWE